MTTTFEELFGTGGADGGTLTTANTGFTAFNGAPTFTAADAIHGTLAARCQASASVVNMQKDIAATDLQGIRAYFKVKTLPTSAMILPLMRVRVGGSTICADVRINNSGQIVLRNASGVQDTSALSIAANHAFGLDLLLDTAAMAMDLRIYTDLTSTATAETMTGVPTAGSFSRVLLGAGDVSYTGTVIVDSVKFDDAAHPGAMPVTAPPPAPTGGGLHKYAVRGNALVPITAYRVTSGGALV